MITKHEIGSASLVGWVAQNTVDLGFASDPCNVSLISWANRICLDCDVRHLQAKWFIEKVAAAD